jgi:hypothetical protein
MGYILRLRRIRSWWWWALTDPEGEYTSGKRHGNFPGDKRKLILSVFRKIPKGSSVRVETYHEHILQGVTNVNI